MSPTHESRGSYIKRSSSMDDKVKHEFIHQDRPESQGSSEEKRMSSALVDAFNEYNVEMTNDDKQHVE